MKWCTYESKHPSGFFYRGKGITENVLSGKYKGSGTRFKLALLTPGFEFDFWTTDVLQTFATEDEAYEAEALLVPIELLANPYCMNCTAGGRKGAYSTPNKLLRSINAAKKAANRKARLQKERDRKASDKAVVKALKDKIKELK